MSRERELGYAFAPIPRELVEGLIRGEISREVFDLHLLLFQRANTERLMRREVTPVLLRTSIADGLGREDNDALTKLIRRERKRGRLDYEVVGNRWTGYRYAFRLHPEAPWRSDQSPTKTLPKGSDRKTPETGFASDDGALSPSDRSDEARKAGEGQRSEQRASGSDQEGADIPHLDAGSPQAATKRSPTASDLREKPNPCSKEDIGGGESVEEDDVGEGNWFDQKARAAQEKRAGNPQRLALQRNPEPGEECEHAA